MKYILIVVLVMMVAVLGCTPAPKENAPADQQIENTATDTVDAYAPGSWTENWDLAIAASKELERPILVNFTGSDWCSWCIRLANEVFTKEEFIDYAAKNLVLLKLDYPRKMEQSASLKKQNDELLRQFGVQGFPTIILVNQEAKEIARTGYQQGGVVKYIEHLQELLSN